MVFISEWFLEVAIESWLDLDLNLRPLNSIEILYRLSYQAMSLTRACT